ncbi:hypothetical protein ASC95_07335 [Pelomonas sp. Root1217]|uniref:PEP-CTERM sorting domain-containing protein n=1 Tax=Pelomonas sp. Root1217 TaxID=1736430 RepID=UPI00070B3EF0|nr:PEP-CTERM sorting domain-containing protein [Pelomonas sp. Root1217]KQV52632.1 hypothetical protein ASC95_07335 [Pelomonas sp. Root1217]
MKTIAAAVLVLALAPAFAAGPNLVVNGSFEADAANPGNWLIVPTLTGWVGAPDIEVQNNFEGNVSQDGLYHVELDTFGNSAMSQTITATGWVELSFWYSPRTNVAAGSNTLGYSLGSLSGTLLDNVAGGSTTQWQHFSATVDLGQSGSALLRFDALGVSDQYGGLIDNVSVTAVPEPASGWLALAGGGALAGWLRRRRTAP